MNTESKTSGRPHWSNWEKVHVFISSTFEDMHGERDYLVKRVFPELQDWCERRRLRLVDIDLRWGVTEQDATHNKNVVKVCLNRIDDCRPFFLCFLGQRRGWVPEENEVSGETLNDFPELRPILGEASVTELEIIHALISPLHGSLRRDEGHAAERYQKAQHSFFYLRGPSYLERLPQVPAQLRQAFTNEGIDDNAKRTAHDVALRRWREVEIPQTGQPVHQYEATWDENATTPELMLPLQCSSREPAQIARWRSRWEQAHVSATSLNLDDNPAEANKAAEFNRQFSKGRLAHFKCEGTQLSEVIIEDLQAAIVERYPSHAELEYESDLQKEIDQQEQFLFAASEGFIAREGEFAELDEYVVSDSNQLFALTAPGGMGKSTLLANWVDRYRRRCEGRVGHSIHFRFVGQSDGTTNCVSLLRFLLEDIKEVAGKLENEIPLDPARLRAEWPELLKASGRHGKTVIVIDAVNQLDTGLTDVGWLPRQLPENIKLIVSFKRGDAVAEQLYERFSADTQVRLSQVKPFESLDDRRRLVRAYLSQYLKELDDQHLETLINLHGAENPLYLKVVLSELRVFGAYGNLASQIRSDFGDKPVSAFTRVLERLENDPTYSPIVPKEAVPLLFGLLAHARRGLSVDELRGVFSETFSLGEGTQAVDTINLLLRQMRSFLARREGRHDFFFESFKTAVEMKFVTDAPARTGFHGKLASCFRTQANEDWSGSARSLRELPFHLNASGQQPELRDLLLDITYLQARCNHGDVYQLLMDFDLIAEPDEAIREMKQFIFTHAQRLHEKQDVLFGLIQHEGPPTARQNAEGLLKSDRWKAPWLKTTLVPLPVPEGVIEGMSIKVVAQNSFERSAATSLADGFGIAFFLKRLGQIGMIDTNSMRELPEILAIPAQRILGLFASADATMLAVAFENGDLLVLELEFSRERALLAQRERCRYQYLVPETESPVMRWHQNKFLFQRDEGKLIIVEGSKENAISLPRDCFGELSGAVFTNGEWVVTIRSASDSKIWRCGSDDKLTVSAADVTSTACGGEGVMMAALSDRSVRIFETSPSLRQTHKLTTEALASCVAHWQGGVVFDDDNKLKYWDWLNETLKPLTDDKSISPRYLRVDQLCVGPEGELLLLGDFFVCRFELTEASQTEGYVIDEVLIDADGAIYVIQKRGEDLWLVEPANGNELCLMSKPLGRHFYAVDGCGHLLTLGASGPGVLVTMSSHTINPVKGPVGLNSVTASNGVFWLADRFGGIYRLAENGALTIEYKITIPEVSSGRLFTLADRIVWRGKSSTVSEENPYGDPQDCLLFFEVSKDLLHLQKIGFRGFGKEGGKLQALSETGPNELLAIFHGDSELAVCARTGTAEKFLSHSETTVPLDFGSSTIDCVRHSEDDALFLCAGDNDLIVIGLKTMRTRCRLSVSRPFTALAGNGHQEVIAVQAGKRLYRIRMEVPVRAPTV
jgi:hypothetical protein